MRPSPDGAGAIMSLCARRAGVLAGRACCRTGVLPHGPPRRRGREGEPRAGPHEPYGHALWPGCPADTWDGPGFGTTAQRHNGTTAQRHNGTTAQRLAQSGERPFTADAPIVVQHGVQALAGPPAQQRSGQQRSPAGPNVSRLVTPAWLPCARAAARARA
jgi:hypothetical protein